MTTVELAEQLRAGVAPETLDASDAEVVQAYKLWTAALIREGRFAGDMARCALDLAEITAAGLPSKQPLQQEGEALA